MRIDGYDWPGGREAMLRFGPEDGPTVVVASPLFEEANRTRRFVVELLRRLAARGIAAALPDLPGSGESVVPTIEARLEDMRAAFAAAVATVGDRAAIVALRGGALVAAGLAQRQFHFDPVSGATLVRDLLRARRAALLAAGAPLVVDDPREPGPPLMLAGNAIDRALLAALLDAEPAGAERTRMLFPAPGSPHPALRGGTPVALWRAAEPGEDAVLAAALATEIAEWVTSCAG